MDEFIRNATEQIRCVKARGYVAKELSDHILDQAAAYEEQGASHEEAVGKAVREMGDPVEIGVELDRIHRPQTDYKLIGMAILFSLGGFLLLCTVGGLTQASGVLARQCILLMISFGVMVGIYFLDYSFIGRYAFAIYAVMAIGFLVFGMLFAISYADVPELLMFVYLFIPVYAGILYRLRGEGYGAVGKGSAIQIVTVAITYRFTHLLHTALIVYLICMALLLTAIWKEWYLVNKKLAVAAVIGVSVLIPAALIGLRLFAYGGTFFFMERLKGWIDPAAHASGAGYVYQWIRTELGSAKLIGGSASWDDYLISGSSNSIPYEHIAEPFIVLYIVRNYGILAGVVLALAFAIFIVRAFHIVRQQKNQLGFMISAGCFMVFLVNCVEGMLINTGYYPVTNTQLPFVSCCAGAMITYAVFIGLLLSIHRYERIITDKIVMGRPRWRVSLKVEKR